MASSTKVRSLSNVEFANSLLTIITENQNGLAVSGLRNFLQGKQIDSTNPEIKSAIDQLSKEGSIEIVVGVQDTWNHKDDELVAKVRRKRAVI